jgi:hypothetical protein
MGDVSLAQTSALQNQRSAVDILTRRLVASVSLIQALGGGWDSSRLPLPRICDTERTDPDLRDRWRLMKVTYHGTGVSLFVSILSGKTLITTSVRSSHSSSVSAKANTED